MKINKAIKAATEAELISAMKELCKEYPKQAITIDVTFGTVRAYVYRNRSSVPVDNPDTRFMLAQFKSVAMIDGQFVKATKGWENKKNKYDNRTAGR